jgi:hypothetical protein
VHTSCRLLIAVVLSLTTWIHLDSTVSARPRGRAAAGVTIDEIVARSSVLAWRRRTVIYVDLAVVAAVTEGTDTSVCKYVVEASGSVETRSRRALVQLRVARPHGHITIAT